jgi:restriction system protein
MNGIEYERYCVDHLRRHGYTHIQLTKASGDQGIDIIANLRGRKYGFQCKYYERPVGNSAVQQAYAGAAFYGCDTPAVITNTVFTASAVKLADETGVRLYEKIDPDSRNRFFGPAEILFLIIFASAAALLVSYASFSTSSMKDMRIWFSISILCGSFSGLLSRFHISFAACSMFCFLCSILLSIFFFSSIHFTEALLLCAVLILSAVLYIRITAEIKKNVFRNAHQETSELRKNMHEVEEKIGLNLMTLLEDEMHCSLKMKSSECVNSSKGAFVYHADTNIEELLAVAEYSLNQYARHENTKEHYTLQKINSREFSVTVTN